MPALVPVVVENLLTLTKLRERRIRVDDDAKVRYERVKGRNVATYFRKTAGF